VFTELPERGTLVNKTLSGSPHVAADGQGKSILLKVIGVCAVVVKAAKSPRIDKTFFIRTKIEFQM
jgi:hypothetical protein